MSNKWEYTKKKVSANFKTKKAFYVFYMPIQMSSYKKLKEEFRANGIEPDFNTGMIEQGKMFGFGKIGLKVDNGGDFSLDEEFNAIKITGKYSQMKEAYKQIMQDHPEAKTFYNLYTTDPDTTPEAENITYILFK